ncbi:PAS domain-containing sensor histidine kinase [Clostridium sediminicola]|uniref:PAS domain-containing sensor histidine kinase n=1 Tax=Clostridium sediminicola TaxID=3114879 RepID=UPI0031F1E721
MEHTEVKLRKKINDNTSIVKLILLFFCDLIIYNSVLIQYDISSDSINGYLDITLIGCSVLMVMWTTFMWWCFVLKANKSKNSKLFRITESLLYVVIITVLISISNTYLSQYKLLYLLIIITSTIQIGMKFGMFISLVSSVIILGMDLICVSDVVINVYFQNDLILAGVFILSAYTLGNYVSTENENIRNKDMKLKGLNNELIKKDMQRRYIEDILIKNKNCYNLLINNSSNAIIIHSKDRLLFANESALKMLGFSSEEQITNKSVFEFVPDDEKCKVNKVFSELYSSIENMYSFEQNLLKCDNSSIVVENISTYLIYKGQHTILSILRDITPEKQVEKLQMDVEHNVRLLNESREFNKMVTEFFTNISHELKTPLNVIFSALQLLNIIDNSDKDYTIKKNKYLSMMKQNCYRLTKLINNLLDVTKSDSGFITLKVQNNNIVSVVENIVLSVVSYVESKKISLVFDTNVEEKIMAFDPNKLERIVLNLLSNAVKFTDVGGEIFVNIIDNIDHVLISVKDTGVGIPEGKLDMIFERFGQVDKTSKRNHEGTGIGLSLVKSFVELHGGKIDIKSKFGEGSEFIVNLPVKLVDKDTSEESILYDSNIERINIEFSDVYSD